jgi:hypothetical protein
METVFEFYSYNKETVYVFGTEDEAIRYLYWMNLGRGDGIYYMTESTLTLDEADTLAINLCDVLSDIESV